MRKTDGFVLARYALASGALVVLTLLLAARGDGGYPTNCVMLKLTVGDPSGNHSER